MEKYRYTSATGPIEIEIEPYWAAILKTEDKLLRTAERKHVRPDHKYAPGEPIFLEDLMNRGKEVGMVDDEISASEVATDLERALATLTELQRRYFVLSRLEGYSYAEIARQEGKDSSTVREIVLLGIGKLKKYFG